MKHKYEIAFKNEYEYSTPLMNTSGTVIGCKETIEAQCFNGDDADDFYLFTDYDADGEEEEIVFQARVNDVRYVKRLN